ncbi:MAG: helix-turn-helix domain-containing protein [Candidatus Limnocylindrales bacterium]
MWDPSDVVPPGVTGGQSIGQVVRAWRIDRGWSQRGLERVSGVPQATISRLEHGALRGVKLATLGRLAWALKAEEAVFLALAPEGEYHIRLGASYGLGPTAADLQRTLHPSRSRARQSPCPE